MSDAMSKNISLVTVFTKHATLVSEGMLEYLYTTVHYWSVPVIMTAVLPVMLAMQPLIPSLEMESPRYTQFMEEQRTC